jgi:acetyl-CoA carboxylase biotin carboxylase subunit
VNAGSVEFLLDRSGKFYFLEVNTRLQVEHPVTEMTTGLDLVREQLQIAVGDRLRFHQEDVLQRGHAIECRVYAEDPEKSFFPSPGVVLLHCEPAGPGIRNDCGIYEGFRVPVEYDPIIGKVIAYGETREASRRRMIRALENYAILGIQTTIPYLIDILKSPEFAAGDLSTDFIERHFKGWRQSTEYADTAKIAFIIDDLTSPIKAGTRQKVHGRPTPWETLGDWRL